MSCQCNSGATKCDENRGYQYAVKVVCGVLSENSALTPLNPGAYRTIINIHNPSNCEVRHFDWKVAAAGKETQSGPITKFFAQQIRPDSAIEISCAEAVSRILPLMGTFDPNNALFEGWVVIESSEELDVVAVYSAGPRKGELTSFHTERVPARCISLCEDFTLTLNTGTASWETQDPAGNWVSAPIDKRASNIAGARWLVPAIPYVKPKKNQLGQSAEFRLCFDLCAGATIDKPMVLSLRADDRALVRVNGQIPSGGFYSASGGWSWHTEKEDGNKNTAIISVPGAMLVAGRNCIQVTLQDQWETLWGWALAGELVAIRGKCPCSNLPLLPCGNICYRVKTGPFGHHIDSGCQGQSVPPSPGPIRSLQLDLVGAVPGASVRLKFLAGGTWSGWIPEGTWGGLLFMQDLAIELVDAPLHCSIEYRVLNDSGWTPWVRNGLPTGSSSTIWGFEARIA